MEICELTYWIGVAITFVITLAILINDDDFIDAGFAIIIIPLAWPLLLFAFVIMVIYFILLYILHKLKNLTIWFFSTK